MDIVFTLIVLCTAIVGMFSQEFTSLFKRIFSIPGAPLFLPLILISLIVETRLIWVWALLASIRSGLVFLEAKLASLMPQHVIMEFLVQALVLTLLPVIPMLLVAYLTRKNTLSDPMFYMYRISAAIWLISAILFVTISLSN